MKKIIALLLLPFTLCAIDNPHFYRANFFWGEPRLEKPWLTSFDINMAGGQSATGRNSCNDKTPLLNIYGPQNMQSLGNTPGLDAANPLDAILINLAAQPTNGCFAHLRFTGDFDIFEGTFNLYQNFTNGFFAQAYLPFRHLKVKKTNNFIDLSPQSGSSTIDNPEWQAFLNNFDAILNKFNLSKQCVNELGLGDFTVLLGWTTNYQDTVYSDYIDITGKVGVLFPTAGSVNKTKVFGIPLGYDGFYGIPIKFDCSIGFFEWLTLGTHIGALFLLEETRDNIRMKSVENQADYFMLTTGTTEIDPGTLWEVDAYIKADHIWRGVSALIGYTFTQRDKTVLDPKNTTNFTKEIVNSNLRLKGWDMHVVHFNLEWDFTKTPRDIGPRVGFFYNYVAGGKRIFSTAMKDGSMGFDFAWCF